MRSKDLRTTRIRDTGSIAVILDTGWDARAPSGMLRLTSAPGRTAAGAGKRIPNPHCKSWGTQGSAGSPQDEHPPDSLKLRARLSPLPFLPFQSHARLSGQRSGHSHRSWKLPGVLCKSRPLAFAALSFSGCSSPPLGSSGAAQPCAIGPSRPRLSALLLCPSLGSLPGGSISERAASSGGSGSGSLTEGSQAPRTPPA